MNDNEAIENSAPSKWWITFPVGLAIIGIVLAMAVNHYRTELYSIQDKYQNLRFRSIALEDDVARLRNIDTLFSTTALQVTPAMTDFELAVLSKKGLGDPYSDLAADLTGEPVLSQADNITLSKPVFLFADQVCVLGSDRAVAQFRDDDMAGRALLSYEVSDEGWISWKIIGQEID
jgi:hypothetical protein